MRSGWSDEVLGNLCNWLSGGTPSKNEPRFWNGDVPWHSAATMHSNRLSDSDLTITADGLAAGSKLAPEGSTLLLVRGMSLHKEIRVAHAMRAVAFNQDVKALVPGPKVDSWFLTWFLMGRRDELLGLVHEAGHGTGVLATDVLQAMPVYLPPIDEQKRIADVLGALDELIERDLHLASQCEQLWRSLAARVVEGGATARLSDLAQFANGRNFTKDASASGRPIIRTPEVREGVGSGTLRADVAADQVNVANTGDLLFVWSGSLCTGRWLDEEALVNQHVFKVIPAATWPAWLVEYSVGQLMDGFLSIAADKATTMGHIKRADLDAIVPVPDSDVLPEATAQIEPIREMALQLRVEARSLHTTRDELLPLLLSGKVVQREVAA